MAQATANVERAAETRPPTVIAAGVVIKGDVEGVTDLHVQGLVVGKVAVGDLVVDAEATIDGPVTADAFVLSGRVIGPVKARAVHLTSTARLEGDVACENIRIDAGARFTGRCIAEDALDPKVVPFSRGFENDPDLQDAGQELLRLAARLRQVT